MRILVLSVLLATALTGCANLNSINHRFKPDEGDSLSVDAKQRTIFTVTKEYSGEKTWKAICAEPSPDALSALSASGAIDASVVGKALGLAYGTQEGAASIGLRTQTITILRDAMYRLCEGYASNALDEISFSRLQRRYQNIMLGLLSIEQLTGTVVANQAIIHGNLSAKLGQSLGQVTEQVQAARDGAGSAKSALEKASASAKAADEAMTGAEAAYKAALTAANGDVTAAAVKEAQTTLTGKKAAAAEASTAKGKAALDDASAKAELASLEKLREDLDRASVTAATAGSFQSVSARQSLDSAGVIKIADTVKEIVREIVHKDFTYETCMDTLLSRGQSRVVNLKLALRFCGVAVQSRLIEVASQSSDPIVRKALLDQAATVAKSFNDKIDTDVVTVTDDTKKDQSPSSGNSSSAAPPAR
jgi:hypothetical protein